jgi:hemerythrin-like domain-containing protein
MAGSDARCIRQIAADLADEHREMEVRWSRLRQAVESFVAGRQVDFPEADAQALIALCKRHVAFENNELLPMAQRLLSDHDLLCISDDAAPAIEKN